MLLLLGWCLKEGGRLGRVGGRLGQREVGSAGGWVGGRVSRWERLGWVGRRVGWRERLGWIGGRNWGGSGKLGVTYTDVALLDES